MSDLYKLIVVDDEFFIRDGLASYDWERLGFEIVGTAGNGQEAINLMSQVEADLILTDIKMPIMDGLKLSKILKETYPLCNIVVLTGYKEFEYVRESIQTGVIDYLLKPVDFNELDQLAKKIKLKLDNEKSSSILSTAYKQKLEESFPIAVDTFLKDIVSGNLTDFLEIEEKMNFYEISLKSTFFNCTIIQLIPTDQSMDITLSYKAIMDFCNKSKEYLATGGIGYIYFDSIKYELVLLLNYSLANSSSTPNSDLINIIEQVKQYMFTSINETLNFNMFLGVGNAYDNLFAIPLSYKEASEALNKKFFAENTNTFFHWIESHSNISSCSMYPYEKEALLLNSIFDGNLQDSKTFLHMIFQDFDNHFIPLDSSNYKRVVIRLINYIDRKLASNNLSLQGIAPNFTSYVDIIEAAPTLSNMKQSVENLILQLIEYINCQNNQETSASTNAIRQAVKYVNDHFNEKITLVSISEKVFLTPNYFSAQFKKETGKNFVEYVKLLRIQKSKELLNETNLKVYEISEIVGYDNPKYFTDVFKDFTGISPLEFRQKSIKNLK